ncbi:hypothetical protein [Pseudoalteromonas luteoviolacea]|uniref:Uncharacterized protein n=1 Tax=Pseudoalteromonas luteoviolacea (strain 2ta16) TaxID=1353533 RepID=V4J6K0_PSEL2|nr:hypothetical protein [Pseudoalteromonas luteoviolacea]ESP90932.1 hypothetical protein PL2TA16_01323 [Pseudoalteromonas luteoviolacea 2ta16]KZN38311.1 hypothetical protein N483_20360 [Pseudoalteromonas luteoviolacea NCIMB 1944]
MMNKFSRNFLHLLESTYPNWQGLAREVNGYFELEIASPDYPELELTIDTDEEEVIIGFGKYHCHWDGLGFENIEEEWRDVLQFIDNLITNKIQIVSWYKDGNWSGSSWVYRGEEYEPNSAFDNIEYTSWLSGI